MTDGVCLYLAGDTPHIWTGQEIAAQTARYRLPVFVRSNPPGPGGAADAAAALARLKAIGAPKGCLVAWDMETAADAAYVRDVHAALAAAGHKLIIYGSQSTVTGNDNPDGLYWGAQWSGVPHLAYHDAMTQWVSFSAYDESTAQATLPFWDTKAGPHTPAPPPPPVPKPLPAGWEKTVIDRLPVLRQGARDTAQGTWWVRRVQGLCAALGWPCAADGAYGPATAAAVTRVQASHGVAADGITGPVTWSVLLTGAAP